MQRRKAIYNKVLHTSCNLLNTVLQVKGFAIGGVWAVYPHGRMIDRELQLVAFDPYLL